MFLAGVSAATKAFTGAVAGEILSSIKEMVAVVMESSSSSPSLHIPELPKKPVDLDDRVEELKKKLFKENISKVGISAMGGSGKTILAAALCKDPQVIEHFGNNIIFQTVSQSPNILGILESMWERITEEEPDPEFHSIEDAHTRLQQWLYNRQPRNWFRMKKPENILVVLDDVWPEVNLRALLFEAEGYKTVVMSRHSVEGVDDAYELPLLGEEDALSLFRFWAFGEQCIPDGISDTLVKQVAAECQGLPLALEVIGCSLMNEPLEYWEWTHSKLSQGEPISKNHEALLKHLAMSTERLDNDMKKCFLDLGLFLDKNQISVAVLLDIWTYVHNIKPIRAYKILRELENRKLLNLINDLPGDHPYTYYGSNTELCIVQHDVLRSLAIYLAANEQTGNICKRLRLFPNSWKAHSDENINAEIVSIHNTGSMNEKLWSEVEFPEARALVLIFSENECFLPAFLQTMSKLKVLIIINQNSITTKLEGMLAFKSLAQLRSLRLEKLIVPPLGDYIQYLKKLQKLSLSLCKGDKGSLDIEVCSKLIGLVEISIDHCLDIKELPANVCNLPSLERLTITNCHDLQKLPDNLQELAGSLKMLMLAACPALKELPASICDLNKLEFLDISQCQCIQTLPHEFGKLQGLKYLYMRECQKLRSLPNTATGLRSLKFVICDKQLKTQWSGVKQSIPNLSLDIAEVKFSLGWLDR
ncbi:hypothetical protein KI387_001077 [Taxus chinensis]|uniref:Uncharacterized protein n=1 Tax=Taxus chinensis TaxID=29808 RepID=A0AA38LMA7_TAXCH|nr:hypothetical protein KI387_001077 [Taxus chinensis]